MGITNGEIHRLHSIQLNPRAFCPSKLKFKNQKNTVTKYLGRILDQRIQLAKSGIYVMNFALSVHYHRRVITRPNNRGSLFMSKWAGDRVGVWDIEIPWKFLKDSRISGGSLRNLYSGGAFRRLFCLCALFVCFWVRVLLTV